jgi:microsomal epoxide hydrolase
MGFFVKLVFFGVVPLVVALYVFVFLEGDGQVPTMVDGWWGRGPAPALSSDKEDQKPPVRFTITTSNDTLIDLRRRLHRARIPDSLEGTNFEYGLRGDFLRHLVKYWKDDFSWEKQQEKLNAFPHFLANIEGIDVHFVRVEPTRKVEGKKWVILLIHGWPGSFWEFYKLIPMLTGSQKGETDDQDVTGFEVICPSIPGYGFSEAPHKPGFDGSDATRVFYKLMRKLGHDRFYVQGGDWGGLIAKIMAQAYPDHVIGVHVNFAPVPFTSLNVLLRQVVGGIWPSLIYSPAELKIRTRRSFIDMMIFMIKETGYTHIQATKPDTVAAGLNDSPAGLAAYIVEKFSTWSNSDNRNCSDGCITKHFTLDEVLTNVMIYWLNGNIGSSMRFYKEFFSSNEIPIWDSLPILVPSGIAAFPDELLQHTRSIIELKYRNIVHYTDHPRGGHFAAFEEPLLMANDIKDFVRTVGRL